VLQALSSVGIDVGSSTTQLLFSRLELEDSSAGFSAPEVKITARRVTYRGKIHPTPLLDGTRIDARELRKIVEGEYAAAGIGIGSTDTGAVIITGESARKENAAAVLAELSGFAGDFVVATAGPDLESRLAGQGSGAQEISRRRGCRVVNIDVGGGTSNLAFFENGSLVGCACHDIGGKLLLFDVNGEICGVSSAGRAVCGLLGLAPPLGQNELERLADALAGALFDAALCRANPLLELTRTLGSSPPPQSFDGLISFSGGVADCIWSTGLPSLAYGDFGVYLGAAIRRHPLFGAVIPAEETIRATVIGAGSHATELSGSTVFYSSAELLPLRNLPCYEPTEELENELWRGGEKMRLAAEYGVFLRQTDCSCAVLCLRGRENPSFSELTSLADSLAAGLTGEPLVVAICEDNAKALGTLLSRRTEKPLLVLDSIKAGSGTYLDIGRPVLGGSALPVVVKTLIFGTQ
jgi:ethanolamine utilization protein EutA